MTITETTRPDATIRTTSYQVSVGEAGARVTYLEGIGDAPPAWSVDLERRWGFAVQDESSMQRAGADERVALPARGRLIITDAVDEGTALQAAFRYAHGLLELQARHEYRLRRAYDETAAELAELRATTGATDAR